VGLAWVVREVHRSSTTLDGGARTPRLRRRERGGEPEGEPEEAASVVRREVTGNERRDRDWDALAQIIGLQCLNSQFYAGQRIAVVTTAQGAPVRSMGLLRRREASQGHQIRHGGRLDCDVEEKDSTT